MPRRDLDNLVLNAIAGSKSDRTAPEGAKDMLRTAWRRSYAGLSAIAVFSVFINVLKLATPLYALQILDRVIASRSHETLIMLTAITLIAIATAVLLEVVRRRMFMHWGSWIERSFGPKLFTSGLNKESVKTPSTSVMLRDVATVRSFVSGTGLIAWMDLIWAPLFIGCVFLISPTLAYIVIVAVIIALALGTLNELTTRESRDATYKARKDDREWVASAERNQETVGSLNMAANLANLWSRSAFSRLDEGMRTRTAYIHFAAAMRFVGRCVRIAVFGVGIWLVIDEVLTIGSIVAVNVLGRTAYSLVEKAMLRWRDMVTAKRAYERIKTYLRGATTRTLSVPNTDAPSPLFIERASYRYPNQAMSVFRGIEVTVEPGEVLCVIGPSATGKTTFARLASGLVSPRSGKIRLGDVDVLRLQQESAKRYIGHLPQSVSLFAGTVRENIGQMAVGDINQAVAAAKLVGVHETILKLPQGYDTEISENEPLLSAGQRKKITLARAFYGQPPLVVLDEPSPHLDRTSRAALRTAISTAKSNGSIVVVTTQSKSLSRIADKVILLTGNKHEVLRTPEEISALRNRRSRSDRRKDDNRRRNEREDLVSA